MISESALLAKLQHEVSYHQRLPETDFVWGILTGLKMAMCLLKESGREAKKMREDNKCRWAPAQFRQAIATAIGYLQRGDRGRGIRILQTAINRNTVGEEVIR